MANGVWQLFFIEYCPSLLYRQRIFFMLSSCMVFLGSAMNLLSLAH